MINNIGFVFLASALAVSAYGIVVPHIGVRRNNWNLVRSAQFATILNLLFVALASAVLVRGFLTDDFSMRFVWQNSSTDLPLGYKLSSFRGGMDGSLLFWELILAGFSAFVAYAYQRNNREIIPYVIIVLNVIQVFLLLMLVTWSNPLAVQSPIPLEGRGLNPLLQHPSMAAQGTVESLFIVAPAPRRIKKVAALFNRRLSIHRKFVVDFRYLSSNRPHPDQQLLHLTLILMPALRAQRLPPRSQVPGAAEP